jgi:hypothetical protein
MEPSEFLHSGGTSKAVVTEDRSNRRDGSKTEVAALSLMSLSPSLRAIYTREAEAALRAALDHEV